MSITLLKRRLNPFLLASSVITLLFLAGLSVVYQEELGSMLSQNKELQNEIQEKQTTIQELKEENSNLTAQLASTEDDLIRYIDQNNRLNSEITELQNTIQEQQQTLDAKDDYAANLTERIELLNLTIQNQNETIQEKNESITELNEWLNQICDDDYAANQFVDASQDACDEWRYWWN